MLNDVQEEVGVPGTAQEMSEPQRGVECLDVVNGRLWGSPGVAEGLHGNQLGEQQGRLFSDFHLKNKKPGVSAVKLSYKQSCFYQHYRLR